MEAIQDFNLTKYNSYRIHATCRIAYFPQEESELIDALKSEADKFIVLGNGNNIILSKKYYNEAFIILNGCLQDIEVTGTAIQAESGATILEVSKTALKHGLTGAEFFYDIPSSVGGAVVMNAGTKEGETKNILKRVRYLDLPTMEIREKLNHEIEFKYRNSYFQKEKDKIILKAWFQLELGDQSVIENTMFASKKRRWARQPREFPNCGSVFKRPPGRFVGPMIDELGLKGFTVGGAQVSKKHSGFIVNKGGATGENVLEVIAVIKERVKEEYGINLEVEQRII